MKQAPFWMVWNVGGGVPTFQHTSQSSAESEAQRLAKLMPGHHFVVLESVVSFTWDAMVKADMRPPHDDLPF